MVKNDIKMADMKETTKVTVIHFINLKVILVGEMTVNIDLNERSFLVIQIPVALVLNNGHFGTAVILVLVNGHFGSQSSEW